jgi:hypothetical protein
MSQCDRLQLCTACAFLWSFLCLFVTAGLYLPLALES